ncbi:mevalonate kinase [Corynebacterium terpenotabidum]|uniref:Mevalonate kinase n=1 Tax=Corynebacterium terpenotabidum Y-11 TaxID=1200352 RepID=S4XB57_9CORY|nr:mevalonate kinase [Corynebacterium terpenotabidum]AGP30357.1 Mevalonate kinase [Corynebacterium terpenotabidum Y-11]
MTSLAGHPGYGQTVAKIILFGEHSVVYGHPAVAMPLQSLKMTAEVEPSDGPGTLAGLGWSGPLDKAPARFSSIIRAAEVASAFAGHAGAHLHITTDAGFPAERGLGSSAAAAGAVIRAVLDAFDAPATPDEIFTLTQQAERVAHGRPSGLDAVATSADGPVHFRGGVVTELDVSPDAWIVIADSGIQGSTRETVGHVRARYEADPDSVGAVLARLGDITDEVIALLHERDTPAIGRRATEAHRLLASLGVSNDRLDILVNAALSAGALGAKLTGGGRGGCVIAFADSEESAHRIEHAFVTAGAAGTWVHAPEPGSLAGEVAR